MRVRTWLKVMVMSVVGMCWMNAPADATVVWDPTAGFLFGQGGTAGGGAGGGVEFNLSDTDFGNFVYSSTVLSIPENPLAPGAEVQLTAQRLSGSDPDATLLVLVGEPNAGISRREIFSYAFRVGDFSDTGFSTLSVPVGLPTSIFNVDLVTGGGFDGNPIDGVADWQTGSNGIDQILFQTPTADGQTTTNDGPVNIEILAVEVTPEPASLMLVGLGGLFLLRRQR